MQPSLYKELVETEEAHLSTALPEEIHQLVGPQLVTDEMRSCITSRLLRSMQGITFQGSFYHEGIATAPSSFITAHDRGIRASTVNLWDPKGTLLASTCLSESGTLIAVNRQGTHVLTSQLRKPIQIWRIEGSSISLETTIDALVPCHICFSPDGTQVVTFGKGDQALRFL